MTCDRILIINRGRLVADGSTEELRRRFMGGDRLLVQTKNGSAEAGEVFAQLPSVMGVSPADTNGGGWYLDTDPDATAEEEVFRCCVERNWVLTQLTPVESSLEDVFRELTKESHAS